MHNEHYESDKAPAAGTRPWSAPELRELSLSATLSGPVPTGTEVLAVSSVS